jgi:hypothetical protein
MVWMRRTWWLVPAILVVAFDVWAALTQLGVVGTGADVDAIAAVVWFGFAVAGGAGLLLRDRRPCPAGALMVLGALPALMSVWSPAGVLLGLACVASGVFVLLRATPKGVSAA